MERLLDNIIESFIKICKGVANCDFINEQMSVTDFNNCNDYDASSYKNLALWLIRASISYPTIYIGKLLRFTSDVVKYPIEYLRNELDENEDIEQCINVKDKSNGARIAKRLLTIALYGTEAIIGIPANILIVCGNIMHNFFTLLWAIIDNPFGCVITLRNKIRSFF